jgi:hypothetical protein
MNNIIKTKLLILVFFSVTYSIIYTQEFQSDTPQLKVTPLDFSKLKQPEIISQSSSTFNTSSNTPSSNKSTSQSTNATAQNKSVLLTKYSESESSSEKTATFEISEMGEDSEYCSTPIVHEEPKVVPDDTVQELLNIKNKNKFNFKKVWPHLIIWPVAAAGIGLGGYAIYLLIQSSQRQIPELSSEL